MMMQATSEEIELRKKMRDAKSEIEKQRIRGELRELVIKRMNEMEELQKIFDEAKLWL